MNSALDKLIAAKPDFHLMTTNNIVAETVLRDTEKKYATEKRGSYSIDNQVLKYLQSFEKFEKTLEFGAGYSTVVLASLSHEHTVVNPDKISNKLIKEFINNHDLKKGNLQFIEKTSEQALLSGDLLLRDNFELILIDGAHGFPFPILDFQASRNLLGEKGLLLIDDIHIKASKILDTFIRSGDTEFDFLKELPGFCNVYVKTDRAAINAFSKQSFSKTTFAKKILLKILYRIKKIYNF